MEGVFRFDSKFYQAVGKAVNLIKLNVLWLLFSLPLFTIGAANCALHASVVKVLKNQEGYIFRDFWAVFRSRFFRSLKLWILFLLTGVGLYLDFSFWKNTGGSVAEVMLVLVGMLSFVWLLFLLYAFPLSARMDTDTRTTLKNAGLLAFKHLPKSLYMVLWLGIAWVAGLLWAPVLLAEIFAGAAMVAAIHGKVLMKIFQKEQVPEI